MTNPFFDHPILNSPYENPSRHWELNESGQPTQQVVESRRREMRERIAEAWQGDFKKGVPACAGCHGPAGAGLAAQYPRLAGQFAEYTEAQLKTFRSEERANDPEKMMRTIAAKLSDPEIKAVSEYAAGLR